MADEGTPGTATGDGGNGAEGGHAALNPVFRTAPAPDQGTATPKAAARQGAAQGRAAASGGDDGRSPEELLADAAENGDEDFEPGSIEALKAELAKVKASEDKWKRQSRENEKRAKENAPKAQQYDAYVESQKTEQQRLADQLAAAQAEAQRAREDRFRLLAAAQYDLPPSLIDHLGGGTEDEITERAEAFAAAINERAAVLAAAQAQAAAQQQPRNGGGFRPVESLRPGALPASDNKPADPNAWIRQALNGRR
jgi:hypothetical protein